MREMLGVFAGNELVLGVALGNWLLLMGLGASLARWCRRWRRSPGVLAGLLVCTAILPLFQIIALRGLRQGVFLRGEAIGVMGTVLVSLLVLLPYCLLAGLFLALACQAWDEDNGAINAGKVYAMDSFGSVAGGVLLSFVMVFWFDHVALLVIPALFNLLAAVWLVWQTRTEEPAKSMGSLVTILAMAIGLVVWVILTNPDESSTTRQFPGQRLLFRGNSPYGRLIVTESGGQTNLIENGVVLASTPDIEQAEEIAHFSLAQRPDAKRVLLIGGALSGAVREILRYGVTTLDCVELDPLATVVGRRLFPDGFSDARVRLCETDARQFVRQATAKYDVIIIALPDPTTTQLNRYFTHEFFQETRRILNPGGVLSFAVGRYENYVSPELSRLLSCAHQTAARSFRNLLLLPGLRVYFLASEQPLTTDIASVLERIGMKTRWVKRSHLAATLAPDRLADLERAAGQAAPVNYDFAPVLYHLHLRHWASQFEGRAAWWMVLLATAAVIYVARLRGEATVIFASGFAGSALEIILLLAMQILGGSLYWQIAWVITIFMAGLAVGAWAATRWLEKTHTVSGQLKPLKHREPKQVLFILALGVSAFALLLPGFLQVLTGLSPLYLGQFASLGSILLYAFGLAVLVGALFPIANAQAGAEPHAAARLYTADFMGASLGALLTSGWLIPLMGVAGASYTAGGLNLIAALFVYQKRKLP
jgi:spermidine synthase